MTFVLKVAVLPNLISYCPLPSYLIDSFRRYILRHWKFILRSFESWKLRDCAVPLRRIHISNRLNQRAVENIWNWEESWRKLNIEEFHNSFSWSDIYEGKGRVGQCGVKRWEAFKISHFTIIWVLFWTFPHVFDVWNIFRTEEESTHLTEETNAISRTLCSKEKPNVRCD